MTNTNLLLHGRTFDIRPVRAAELGEVLSVYRQCEDFLALGGHEAASLEMVKTDWEHSQAVGGIYCGIYDRAAGLLDTPLVGVVDFAPQGWQGDAAAAFLSLLMIGKYHRGKGLGAEVVRVVEEEIRKDGKVKVIKSGVQVNNPRAVSFWQRQGYQIVGGPEPMDDGTTVYHLEKQVA